MSKQFQVYGIGNALVDIDIEVSEATLERLAIAKGVMTLIDETSHHRLLQALEGIEHLKACGGSAANTLFTMQQMGGRTFYSCKIGNDEAGDFFYRDLISHGIHTNLHEAHREGVTGKCIVLVTPDADRTMNTFLGATAHFSKAELSEQALKNADYLYIEGYLVASLTAREAAFIARQLADIHHVKTAMSLSDPNMVTFFKRELMEIIGRKVEILFCNETEALLFTDTKDLTLARESLKRVARTFVITLGSQGSLVYDGKDFMQVPSYPAKVIDTVGAGDVFTGAFLYCITHGYHYFEAADIANYVASKVVSKYGPRLTDQEIEACQSILPKEAIYA